MSKDDYIRFRCSTDLKELVAKQAEEKGMNITDYMEYLIRKDRENMMYVYTCTYEWDDELLEKVINNGLAVPTDKDDNSHIISKLDKICIDGQTFNSTYTLEEYIRCFDGGDYVEFVGEWDYITNPLMYFVFKKLVPIYRNIIRRKSKKELQNEVKKTI